MIHMIMMKMMRKCLFRNEVIMQLSQITASIDSYNYELIFLGTNITLCAGLIQYLLTEMNLQYPLLS